MMFRREPWMNDGACVDSDSDLWFPATGQNEDAARAKAICLECPVRQTCLDYALANDEAHGIWGGLSPRQRQAYRRGVDVIKTCPVCLRPFIKSLRVPKYCSATCSKQAHMQQRLEWDRANRARRHELEAKKKRRAT
jgi:WhiB family redox-sensing transcriptional regulator